VDDQKLERASALDFRKYFLPMKFERNRTVVAMKRRREVFVESCGGAGMGCISALAPRTRGHVEYVRTRNVAEGKVRCFPSLPQLPQEIFELRK
ncbi:MAG: hypothetical protein Q9N34_00550, partial [Aquificota bacterium]|nr:hypothetical protein [Aquificota bacterium]